MDRSQRPLASFLATLLLVGLGACSGATFAPTSTPPPNPTPPGLNPAATVLPSAAGTLVELEGVLEVEGSLPQLRFFLLTQDGTRLEILPWLPVEVVQPPDGQTPPETMAAWVGLRVELHGSWVQAESGWVFQVISAERRQP